MPLWHEFAQRRGAATQHYTLSQFSLRWYNCVAERKILPTSFWWWGKVPRCHRLYKDLHVRNIWKGSLYIEKAFQHYVNVVSSGEVSTAETEAGMLVKMSVAFIWAVCCTIYEMSRFPLVNCTFVKVSVPKASWLTLPSRCYWKPKHGNQIYRNLLNL